MKFSIFRAFIIADTSSDSSAFHEVVNINVNGCIRPRAAVGRSCIRFGCEPRDRHEATFSSASEFIAANVRRSISRATLVKNRSNRAFFRLRVAFIASRLLRTTLGAPSVFSFFCIPTSPPPVCCNDLTNLG